MSPRDIGNTMTRQGAVITLLFSFVLFKAGVAEPRPGLDERFWFAEPASVSFSLKVGLPAAKMLEYLEWRFPNMVFHCDDHRITAHGNATELKEFSQELEALERLRPPPISPPPRDEN